MKALELGRRITGILAVMVAVLALGVTPACASDDEAEADSVEEEIRDEADFDPDDGAG